MEAIIVTLSFDQHAGTRRTWKEGRKGTMVNSVWVKWVLEEKNQDEELNLMVED